MSNRSFALAIVLRRPYRIGMSVSPQAEQLKQEAQAQDTGQPSGRGPRARMKRHMLATAIRLMQDGFIPSVSDVAEAAEVSRATAYRYFPSQATMVQAVVDEALGPILAWRSDLDDADRRVSDLFTFAFPRMLEYEATHRAALEQALDQWTRRQAGTLGSEARIVRGNRRKLLRDALAPLKEQVGGRAYDRLVQSLSLIFGVEAIIVLKDIYGLDDERVRDVALWAAQALVSAASAEASAPGGDGPAEAKKKNAARRPRGKGTERLKA
jgi:AcrR family transcriptional regulator